MSFTPPNVASPNKTSALHTNKMVNNNLDKDVSSSASYSSDSYSDSEESFKVIQINRTSNNNNDNNSNNISSSHNSMLVEQSAKNLHAVSELERNIAINNKSRKSQLEESNKREIEEERDLKVEREDVTCAENVNKKSAERPNFYKNEQWKEHVRDNKVISTDRNSAESLSESLSSYSSYSYSESTSSTLSKPTEELEEVQEQEEEEYTESTASPHVKTKVPSQESLLSSYTEEYTQTSSIIPEKENIINLKNTSNFTDKKETNAIENYTIEEVNRGKDETSVSASYSSYSKLSASNSTITQKVKRKEAKQSKEFDVDNARKGNALEQSRSLSSPITSYYTSQSSLEQKSNKSSLLTATPLVAAEIKLNTSSSSSLSYKYSPSSLTSSPLELLEKQKNLDESENELHRSLQELSTATKSTSSLSSSSSSSSSSISKKEEPLQQEHLQLLQKEYDKRELIVVRVEEMQQPITPPLPKRCFVHPLIWHSAEGVYDSKLEDTTSIFLEQLLEMQYRYETIKMGGRTDETAELSSLQVVHGKPFTSSTKRSSASKLYRLFLPSSSSSLSPSSSSLRSKKEESISVKEKATVNMSNNASVSSQDLNQLASERFEHDGRVTFVSPTPSSHFSKRSVNIALSVLGLTRSEKDKLIMEAQPPVTVENFSHLFDACVNTRMKEHVAHTFLSHDTQRKGELPFDETALLLQRCGVVASPWIANVKIDIAAPLQPSLNETSNEYYALDNNKENVKINLLPQLVLTIIKKIIPSDNISTNLPQSSQFGEVTSIFVKHHVNTNNNKNNDANNNSNMMSNDVCDSTKSKTVSEINPNIKQKSQSENAVLQLSSKRNKSRKERHIVEKEQTDTMSDNAKEFTNYEKREICVCDIVDANVLSGDCTSVYWRDNCIYISNTLICTDIKHEEDYERIKTYVEAATYVCILVKMFTICDPYNNYKATVEYPHVVRTLLLAEMTTASLQRKLRKLRSKESLHDKSRNVKDQCSLQHAPRNLYIQNVFRNCYYANKQINKYTQSKNNLQNFRLVSFLEDRLVESSLQETNNSHAKRSRNVLPSARIDNLAFYEPSKKQYTPLSVMCTSAHVQLPAAENIYFKFALITVRVPLLTPESYHCYCLVSAMTSDGVFLPAIKVFVSKVVKSKTFANSETWMFDGVEDENDENVIYYRGHLLDKIFIECCYERKKLNPSDDRNQSGGKNNERSKWANNVNTNSADLSVLNTTNAIGDNTLDQNSRYSSLTTWSKRADITPERIMDKILVEDHTVWSAGYAVLSLPTLQFSKKGTCRKRLNIVGDSVSNYEMTESNVTSSASASASASGNNTSFIINAASKQAVFNAQNEKSSQQIPLVNIFNQNAEQHKTQISVDNKKKSSNDTAQARHIDMVIYSKQAQKRETEYEKSKVDFYDLPSRSLLLRRHVLMISKIREAIRYIGLSSRHTHQALNQFNVNQLLHLVSDANLLNELIKYWKYKMQHMTSKQLESKEYKFERLLSCAGSVSAVHHSTTVPVENIANLLIKKKRLHLSSLLPSTSLSVGATAATATNKNCCHHPVNI